MKNDVKAKYTKQKTELLSQMPEFIFEFIKSINATRSLTTQIGYLKDCKVLLEYLLSLPQFKEYTKISDFIMIDMKKVTKLDLYNYRDYLIVYTKTYLKEGKEIKKTRSNSQYGQARKIASLHTLFQYIEKSINEDSKNDDKFYDLSKDIDITVNKRRSIKERLEKDELEALVDMIINDANIENQRQLKFHQRVKQRDFVMFLLLAFTGIRISELVQLDIDDVSIKDSAMIVIRKGGDQDKLYLPDEIIEPITNYIEARKQITGVDDVNKNSLFLSNQKKRIDPKTVRYMIKKYKQRAGITIKVTPHTLRRTFATKLLNKYKNIELVALQLGHSSIETTRKAYAELEEETKKRSLKGFTYK